MNNLTRYRIIEIMELLSGSILPILFWISLIFGFDSPYIAILTIISAILHEIGHSIAILIMTNNSILIKGHATGFRIKRSDMMTYKEEIAVLLSGPAINIAFFILSVPFGNALSGYVKILGYINLATGVSNLLPFEGYDGHGALIMLFRAKDKEHLIGYLETFSFVLSVLVTFIALHLIDVFGEGYWIFGIFLFTVLSKLAKFGKYDIFRE